MIKIVICDNKQETINFISSKLESIIKTITEYRCFKTTKTKDVIKLTKKVEIDLLLVEIGMPEINGFELVRQIKVQNKKMLVIFVTSVDLYVYESLKYSPFRFVRKSHIEELDEALLSAALLLKTRYETISIQMKKIGNINVKISDIIYFESQRNNVKMVTKNKEYIYRTTLKAVERELEGKGFIRIHSGYLLNLKYIYLIGKTDVEVKFSGMKRRLPISRKKRSILMVEYKKILNSGT